MSSNQKTRILILGGGFAGLHTAIHLERTLARDPNVEITLITRDNFVLFTPPLSGVAEAIWALATLRILSASFFCA